MTWIESNGGPLVVLEERLLDSWSGIGEGHWEPGSGTDYDRACTVLDWIGVIDVGDGAALVLGSEPARTRVLEGTHGAVLIRWIHAPREWEPGGVDSLLELSWERSALWSVTSSAQLIQDAAFAGRDQDAARIRLSLDPGRYEILTGDYRPDAEVRMVLHWLRKWDQSDN